MSTPKLRPGQRPGQGFDKIPVRTTSRILRQLFAIVEAKSYSQRSIGQALGLAHACMTHWKAGRANPSLLTAEEFAQVLGYRLELVPITEGERNVSAAD